jgi:hypothetical protein
MRTFAPKLALSAVTLFAVAGLGACGTGIVVTPPPGTVTQSFADASCDGIDMAAVGVVLDAASVDYTVEDRDVVYADWDNLGVGGNALLDADPAVIPDGCSPTIS